MLNRTFHRTAPIVREYTAPVVLLAALLTVAPPAFAQEIAAFSNLGIFVCGLATFINTKYLFVGGLVLLVFGFISYAASESTLIKVLSVLIMGVGLAAAAPSIMKQFGIGAACTGF
ncbi:hypothetical protein [Cupriavidus basilensis]|uniref:hypothetical protein n=1 Tax=Cupriavidus basilensis TaxID=68895 RepID=UPI0007516BF7|nr:hypothetical protein [Cupriavidus basilensis]